MDSLLDKVLKDISKSFISDDDLFTFVLNVAITKAVMEVEKEEQKRNIAKRFPDVVYEIDLDTTTN